MSNIDKEKGVFKNVVCARTGQTSDGRFYFDVKTLQGLYKIGESARVFLNHDKTDKRNVTEKIGFIHGLHLTKAPDGETELRGDFHALESYMEDNKVSYNRLVDLATNHPDTFGFSAHALHILDEETEEIDGKDYYRPVKTVSFDIVEFPAATKAFFEEDNTPPRLIIYICKKILIISKPL